MDQAPVNSPAGWGGGRRKSFAFREGDVVTFKDEGGNAVMRLKSFSVQCAHCADITGTWIDAGGNSMLLQQTGCGGSGTFGAGPPWTYLASDNTVTNEHGVRLTIDTMYTLYTLYTLYMVSIVNYTQVND